MTQNAIPSQHFIDSFWRSWFSTEGINSLNDIEPWIQECNQRANVALRQITLDECTPWRFNEQTGRIDNGSGTFFEIAGLRHSKTDANGLQVITEQPIILQNEIGYLGIICQEFDGVMHFLMQAKIEPGNVNCAQVSPTLQATRSNFMRVHGGAQPAYLDYFINATPNEVVVDQVQSEQSSRFLGKRNRNVIICPGKTVEESPSHRWMTLGQIKALMRIDNVVNMDTRTVLANIPWSLWARPSRNLQRLCPQDLCASMFSNSYLQGLTEAYSLLNSYRMHTPTTRNVVRIDSLGDWRLEKEGIFHRRSYHFDVIFCGIDILGREVKHWQQPLFRAKGKALFGLITCNNNGKRMFLVKAWPEIGCFDSIEIGPTVQQEAGTNEPCNAVDLFFRKSLMDGKRVLANVLLSEEGGRFYHEQNQNVIIHLDAIPKDLSGEELPSNYCWLDYRTLGMMISSNNNVNIQLRNLLSLLDVPHV